MEHLKEYVVDIHKYIQVQDWLFNREDSELNPRHSGDQKQIIKGIEKLCSASTPEELVVIGDKLMKKKSNIIAHMLVRCKDIEPRHRVAAFKALTKRRKYDLPGKIDRSELYMHYEDLFKLHHTKLQRLLIMIGQGDKIIWKLNMDELGRLLFPIGINNPDFVSRLRRTVYRQINRIDEDKMKEMLFNHELAKFERGELKIEDILRYGYFGVTRRNQRSLENILYDEKVLT